MPDKHGKKRTPERHPSEWAQVVRTVSRWVAEGVTLCAVFLIHWGIKTVSRWLGMESDLSTVWILQAFGYIRAVTVIGVGVFEGLAVIWSAGRAFVQTVRGSGNKVS